MILSTGKENSQKLTVGGQAVIEGVMMRSPWRIATAVRDPEGVIRVNAKPFVGLAKRNKFFGMPVLRGAVGLWEAMSIGIGSLNWAAEIAGEMEGEITLKDRILEGLMMLVAFAIGIGLFMAVPYFVAGLFGEANGNQAIFHLIAGSLRIILLVSYMAAISLIPDIKSVFRYHGAEHKSIYAFECKLDLTVENAGMQSRLHPRCGTSFLLLAAVLTMIGFMLFDTVYIILGGEFANVFMRVLIHLPVIPLIAGLSYEVLRIVERNSDKPSWRPFVQPGFWLQKITTREPDASEIEVALAALKESLNRDESTYEGPERMAEVLSHDNVTDST